MRSMLLRFFRHLVCVSIIATPLSATAGHSIQLFGGYSFIHNTDINVDLFYTVPPVSAKTAINQGSATYGLRYFYNMAWPLKLSMGMELSKYSASSAGADIDIIPVTMSLLYSFQLAGVTPYAGVGYSLTYANIEISETSDIGWQVEEVAFADKWEFLAGVTFDVHHNYSLFLEYRYSMLDMDFETESFPSIAPATVNGRYRTELYSSQIIAGISFQF